MARLVLSLDGQTLAEYNMTKERYTVGRLPDNDIRIDNAAVSGHHSLIINILNDSFLEDLNSTNGTYVNGKLIKKHALQNDDVITVGHHQLRFLEDAADDLPDDEFQKTMVIEPDGAEEEELVRAARAADAATRSPGQADRSSANNRPDSTAGSTAASGKDTARGESLPVARLQVLSGTFAGRELELTKALTTLGRPGLQVAAISRRSDGYSIVHVDSGKEGDYPLVNGSSIGATAHKLKDNDVIELARVKMGFFIG